MPRPNCKSCSEEFYAKPSWIKNGYGKYCSRNCFHLAQKSGKDFRCYMCKKTVYRSLQDQRRSKSGEFFCTKSCQTTWRNSVVYTGSNHPNWVDGKSSYRDKLIRSDRQQVCNRCKDDDKRILAVHHMDRNRNNNELSNLMWLCHNRHFLVHNFPKETKHYITA